jgi:hypothetical protein
MSALPPKADISSTHSDFRFVPKADVTLTYSINLRPRFNGRWQSQVLIG